MRIITDNNIKIALFVGREDIQKGLHFYSEDEDYVQVGSWGYDQGVTLRPHIHNRLTREIDRTQEVVHVIQGAVKAAVYSDNAVLIESLILNGGDTLILLRGGHGYEILTDDTYVLEVKSGSYMGVERDHRRITLNNK